MLGSLSLPWLLAGILAVWRITHLLWGEDGPADLFVRLRRFAGNGLTGKLLDCFYCLSLWVAAPFAWMLGTTWIGRGFLWFALSGGAILLERATSRGPLDGPKAHWEEQPLPSDPITEEIDHVMLR